MFFHYSIVKSTTFPEEHCQKEISTSYLMSVPFTKAYSALHWAWATRSKSNTPVLNELITVYRYISNLDDFTQQHHWCRTERNFSIFIFTQVDQYGMRAIDQNPVKETHTWSRTHHKGQATILNSCHGAFTGPSIFSLNLLWIPTPVGTSLSNHRHRQIF